VDLLWEVHQWERWVLILVGGGEQVSEIARSLGMPIGTALSQLRRGRSHLAAMLKQRRRVARAR
jgi:RNA polymerase sigma-70 factor (ECF subfamily)